MERFYAGQDDNVNALDADTSQIGQQPVTMRLGF